MIRLGAWCGWVLVGVAGLTPLAIWLGPLAFAPILGLAGLLCLPALRLRREDTAAAVVLLLLLGWAVLSMLWSPRHPGKLGDATALKLAAQLPLYAAAWCGARAADRARRRLALRVLAWGLGVCGALYLVEGLTGGAVYMTLRNLVGDPIRPDLGRKNLAQGAFALALLWPVATAAGRQAGAPGWLAAPMAAGTAMLAQIFLSDAPVLSVGLALAAGVIVWTWPRSAPQAFGLGAAGFILLMPLGLLWLILSGVPLRLPLSWAERMDYWTFAAARIADHPFRGWGLDASRMFGPSIGLHPHDGALQVWLELGMPGAVLVACAWAVAFRSLARDTRSVLTAATAGSAAVYLFFGSVSFGIWQEWWLALGALVLVIAALGRAEEAVA